MVFRLKGSSTLVSYFAGTFICLILLTSLIAFASSAKSLTQRLNAETASVIAKSGLEKGIKEFNSIAPGDLKTMREYYDLGGKRAFYDLSYRYDSLSYGDKLDSSNWYYDSRNALDQKALATKGSGKWEIYLGNLYLKEAKNRVSKIEIQYSDPFTLKEDRTLSRTSTGQITNINVELNSSSGNITSIKTASDKVHTVLLDDLTQCLVKGSDCRLSIAIDSDGNNQSLVSFLKIKATSPEGLITPTGDQPGTVQITSEGNYNGEKVVSVYKTKLNGEYLGFTKNGIYCKDKCYRGKQPENED